MKKKTDVTAPARGEKRSKPSSASLDQASSRVRAAKDEHKRLRLLARAAKRDLKEARRSLKKARKLAEPGGVSKPKRKAKAKAAPAQTRAAPPARGATARAKPRRRPQAIPVDAADAGNSALPQQIREAPETEPSAV